MANAKWCVYMGGIRFSSKHAFCLHFVARLPGVCCARIYARRLVLCVVQTANCPMIQESIWEAASKEGRGRISQGGSKGKPDSPPFKNLPKAFSKCFWLFFEGLARFVRMNKMKAFQVPLPLLHAKNYEKHFQGPPAQNGTNEKLPGDERGII